MFPNKLHVFVARFAVALGFVTSCYVNTCYAILCYFQIDILFSCLQQSMMDDGDDETFPSITVTVRKSLGYQITFVQSRQPLRIGLLVTNETPASSQFLIFFCPCDAMQQDAAESYLSKITNKRCPRINAAPNQKNGAFTRG